MVFYDGVAASVDEERVMDVIFLYFSKAFDMVPHHINWRGMNLKDGPFDGLRIAWMVTAKGM